MVLLVSEAARRQILGMFRAALRQLWIRRIDARPLAEAVLRHPSFRDRAPAEKALARIFFAPFEHQEVVTGERFAARARLSRAALALPPARVAAAVDRAFTLRARDGCFDSLIAEVRRVVTCATILLTFGEAAIGPGGLEPIALAAVEDFDRAVKLIAPGDLRVRRRLADALRPRLADPRTFAADTTLGLGRAEAAALSLEERVDHVASVFLGTGIIQLTDVVTHALVALAQHPSPADEAAVVAEILRAFPVNSSITRLAAEAAVVAGRRFARGEAITVVPARLDDRPFDPDGGEVDAFRFGTGPRACPARRLSLAATERLLGRYRARGVAVEPGYRHRRSLAVPVRARVGPGAPPARRAAFARAGTWLRYGATAAITYPRAGWLAAPEIAALLIG